MTADPRTPSRAERELPAEWVELLNRQRLAAEEWGSTMQPAWYDRLEAAQAEIREKLLSLLAALDEGERQQQGQNQG